MKHAPPIYQQARAITTVLATAELPATSGVFVAFKKGYTLYVTAAGSEFVFNLKNSSRALQLTLECSARFAQSNVVATNPANPFEPPRAKPQPESTELKSEATLMLANTLAASGIPDFVIVNDLPKGATENYKAAWKAGELWGALGIFQADVSQTETTIAADDGRSCKADFATARKKSERGAVMFRTACSNGEVAEVANYVITPRGKGGTYVFHVGAAPDANTATAPAASEDAGAKIFDASFKVTSPN